MIASAELSMKEQMCRKELQSLYLMKSLAESGIEIMSWNRPIYKLS